MFSPRRRSSSCSSWAERNSSSVSSSVGDRRPLPGGRARRGRWHVTACPRRRGHGVDDDVRQVVVGQPVEHFAAGPLAGDHARGLENLQVLADQRLWHAQRVDQFVHAALGLVQLQHDGDPHRRGQRAQQLAGGVEDLPRRRRRAALQRVARAGARRDQFVAGQLRS